MGLIFGFCKEHGDQICIVVDSEPTIVNFGRLDNCCVEGCIGGHEYGYNFCRKHRWILPISAKNPSDGFQVMLIEYWKKKGKKIVATHSYERE